MRSMSNKRRKRYNETKTWRSNYVQLIGECMACGCSPKKPDRTKPLECSQLACHEIANGPLRQKALDQPYAILVLCWTCNLAMHSAEWPEARQLALLKERAPNCYDLQAYNALVNPRAPERITQDEVDKFVKGIK